MNSSHPGVRVNNRALLAFLVGCCCPIGLRIVGLLYAGELLLFVIAAWVVLTRISSVGFWSRTAVRFAVLLLLALAGYVGTDLFRATPLEDFIRGWLRIGFILTDFLAFYYIVKGNLAAVPAFFVGYELFSIAVGYYLRNPSSTFNDNWKAIIALPLSICSLCALSRLGTTGIRLGPYLLIALGAIHVLLDYRSLGLVCLTVAAYLLAAKRTGKGKLKLSLPLLIFTGLGCAGILVFLYIASQDQTRVRRDASNGWRMATTVALMKGIMRSPLIGNGSWSSDSEMEAWRDEALQARGIGRFREERFTGHSEMLEAWFEGGLLALVFFLYYGYQMVLAFQWLLRRQIDTYSALLMFLLLDFAFGYFFNPLNGLVRIDVAMALALLCYLEKERMRTKSRDLRQQNRVSSSTKPRFHVAKPVAIDIK